MVTETKEAYYTPLFEKTQASKAKTVVNVGGAGSSKSYSIAQLLIHKLKTEKNKRIGICRKTFPALRMTVIDQLMLPLLRDWGIYRVDRHNKTANTYRYEDNLIQFFALDEPEKIKSANFNYIWMEEANEFTYEDYKILQLRLRNPTKDGERNQMYLSLNPIDANNWIAVDLDKEAKRDSSSVEFIHSTYHDNEFLEKDAVKIIEDLVHQDANFYKIYALGEWGLLQRRIYTNYKVIPQLPEITEGQWAYGLDFGLVNPSAIVKVYRFDDKFYLEEILYKSGLTVPDIIECLSHQEKGDIYADPSAKQMIQQISDADYRCYEAMKDVKAGIDVCQRQILNIPVDSVHLIEEIQSYQWKEDRGGNVINEPVKFHDHLMDAMRYAIYGIMERFGFPTQRPGGNKAVTLHSMRM